MGRNIGDRIGTLCSTHDNIVETLGYGVCEAFEIPVEGVGHFANMRRKDKVKDAKLKLDSGEYIYGCECWWGPEEEVQLMMEEYRKAKKEIVLVKVEQVRKELLRKQKEYDEEKIERGKNKDDGVRANQPTGLVREQEIHGPSGGKSSEDIERAQRDIIPDIQE